MTSNNEQSVFRKGVHLQDLQTNHSDEVSYLVCSVIIGQTEVIDKRSLLLSACSQCVVVVVAVRLLIDTLHTLYMPVTNYIYIQWCGKKNPVLIQYIYKNKHAFKNG